MNQIPVRQTLLFAKTDDGTVYALALLHDDGLAILRNGQPFDGGADGTDGADGTVDRFIQLIGMASR